MTEPMEFHLPLPVSVNSAYYNAPGKGRKKTANAKDWYRLALHHAAPFIRTYSKICDANLIKRRAYYSGAKQACGRPGVRLGQLKTDHPNVGYAVNYTFHFPNDAIRDIYNFEKLLTDLLVDCGFLLDDNFIIDGRVRWGKLMPNNPHVQIEIISLDRQTVL